MTMFIGILIIAAGILIIALICVMFIALIKKL
jgi:hypothetical protein